MIAPKVQAACHWFVALRSCALSVGAHRTTTLRMVLATFGGRKKKKRCGGDGKQGACAGVDPQWPKLLNVSKLFWVSGRGV